MATHAMIVSNFKGDICECKYVHDGKRPYVERILTCNHQMILRAETHWRCTTCKAAKLYIPKFKMVKFTCAQCKNDMSIQKIKQIISNSSQGTTTHWGKLAEGTSYQIVSISNMCMQTYPCQHHIGVRIGDQKDILCMTLFGNDIGKMISAAPPDTFSDVPYCLKEYISPRSVTTNKK